MTMLGGKLQPQRARIGSRWQSAPSNQEEVVTQAFPIVPGIVVQADVKMRDVKVERIVAFKHTTYFYKVCQGYWGQHLLGEGLQYVCCVISS